jgi:hypothetical protein
MNRSDGRGAVANDPEQVLFRSNPLVWAVSKPKANVTKQAKFGPMLTRSYELTEDRYQGLIAEAAFARQRLRNTLNFMEHLPERQKENLVDREGRLTGLGLLADHFNLIRARHIDTQNFFPGRWTMKKWPEVKQVRNADLQILYNTVNRVLTLASEGLNSTVLFRGKSNKETNTNAGGYVVRGKRFEFPEEASPGQGQLPTLADDKIFMNQREQATGHIHLDFSDIDERLPAGMERSLAKIDTCCAWIIIHEATHKFARTRDFGDSGYNFDGCRQLHWQNAVRNAKHYEIFAALQWETIKWTPSGAGFTAKNQDFYGLP